jgi:tRNA G18 (ribose-2'-O)-methylase SpoU
MLTFLQAMLCRGCAETDGLPPAALEAVDVLAYIPIIEKHVRSLNVAVAAGIGLYEAIRQLDAVSDSKAV